MSRRTRRSLLGRVYEECVRLQNDLEISLGRASRLSAGKQAEKIRDAAQDAIERLVQMNAAIGFVIDP